jgi:transcriptional regulator with XRE-family HTH domain
VKFKDLTPEQKEAEKKTFGHRLGKRIRQVREVKKLTQEELADLAGYYRTYVGHIETGRHSPTVHTIWRFSKAMDVDLGDLLKGL